MKYLPKVSIVIPAYNAANYLSEAIESALAQTYKNIEIIVVNDGSNDRGATADAARAYEGKIRYFEKENGGSSSALNYGIKNMTGEWFSWLSHDDLYYPDKVLKQIEFLNQLSESNYSLENHVLFAASEMINEDGKLLFRSKQKALDLKSQLIETIENNCYLVAEAGSKYTFHGCSCLIHKNVFKKTGGFDESLRLVNDIDMWKRMFMNRYKIHFLPQVLVKGRMHSAQVSASIGFSYHNPEQDEYWKSLLNWLITVPLEYDERQKALNLFAHSAYSKTRKDEGKKAIEFYLKDLKKIKKIFVRCEFVFYILKHFIRNIFKKYYRKLLFS